MENLDFHSHPSRFSSLESRAAFQASLAQVCLSSRVDYAMASSGAGGSTQIPCIEIKRLDRGVVGRTHEYPGLVKGTKVLVAGEGAVADSARSLLKAAGCQVTALCTAAATTTPDCTVVEGSATSSDACAKAVVGQQVVVHVGGPSCSAALGLECVTSGTRNLLEAAAAAGVKAFVFETPTRYSTTKALRRGFRQAFLHAVLSLLASLLSKRRCVYCSPCAQQIDASKVHVLVLVT